MPHHSLLLGTHGMLTFLNSSSVHVSENVVAEDVGKAGHGSRHLHVGPTQLLVFITVHALEGCYE